MNASTRCEVRVQNLHTCLSFLARLRTLICIYIASLMNQLFYWNDDDLVAFHYYYQLSGDRTHSSSNELSPLLGPFVVMERTLRTSSIRLRLAFVFVFARNLKNARSVSIKLKRLLCRCPRIAAPCKRFTFCRCWLTIYLSLNNIDLSCCFGNR